MIKKIIFFIFLIPFIPLCFIASLMFISLLSPLEWYNNYYETYEEAQKSPESNKGWIRDWVPDDAYHIRDIHNLSPQGQYLDFSFLNLDKFKHILTNVGLLSFNSQKDLEEQLNLIESENNTTRNYYKERLNNLHKQINPKNKVTYHLDSRAFGGCLVIDWTQQKAYFMSGCPYNTLSRASS